MQHLALLSILYVSSTRLPYVALRSLVTIKAALQIWALLLWLPPTQSCFQQHISLL